MRIEAKDIGRTFGRQTRAYAEFRIFSSLAQFSDVVREAAVSVTPAARGRSVVCSVLVGLETGVPVRVSARGRHAYDAINRVADRLGPALRRHVHVAVPS
jgi:ribosome-associated translation inhibitor RaiA